MAEIVEPGWTSQLIDLLDQQRGLYVQLRTLSREQSELVALSEPDVSSLVLLLGRRQGLIDQLTQVSSRMEPFRRDWPKAWQALNQATRRRIGGLIEEVRRLLEAILDQDEQDRAVLRALRDDVKRDLDRVDRGSAANRAYGAADHTEGGPRFTDRQG